MSWQNLELHEAHMQLERARDILDDYLVWAEDEGYRAVAHKISESYGPLNSAMEALHNYDGTLEAQL